MTMTNDDNDKRDIADACIKKTSLKIPKRQLEILRRRNTDNTMTKKEKGQKDKQ